VRLRPLVFLNNARAICAGREIYGTPKVWADVSLETTADGALGRTLLGGELLIELHTRAVEPRAEADLPRLFPGYRLKLIPAADGSGAAVKQLVTAAPQDARAWDIRGGSGTVQFGTADGLDLRPLQPGGGCRRSRIA
jgi:acetoacetate decarboxylase